MKVIKNRVIREFILSALSWLVFFAFLAFVVYFFMFLWGLDDRQYDKEYFQEYRTLSHQVGGEG